MPATDEDEDDMNGFDEIPLTEDEEFEQELKQPVIERAELAHERLKAMRMEQERRIRGWYKRRRR